MVVPTVHAVEVCSDTTRGPAHSEENVRAHASKRVPPFPGHGLQVESEDREKAHRRPSPTSHEMSSPFVDVPGALATARFASWHPHPGVKTSVTFRHGGNEDCMRGCERPEFGRVRLLHVL
jgi:hypothetical protein